MTLADERKEYERGVLEGEQLGDDPMIAMKAWLDEALEKNVLEPTAMTLATLDADGAPSARVVLCKGLDADGIRFYTNYESRKGHALASDPRAAVTFFWPQLERQIRVEGRTERVTREDSERYFHSRPRRSQIAALASHQSARLSSRKQLEDTMAELERTITAEVPLPDFWGGYLLRPRAIEFWQGRRSRLHDRIVFERDGYEGAFRRGRLSP